MTWLRSLFARLLPIPAQPAGVEVTSLGLGGVDVGVAYRKVIIGIACSDGTKGRLCVLPPEAARQLAWELWAAARRAGYHTAIH